ncbi:DUF58 domain-containing protein [Thalassomonas haliotis]|uniref:DUF58 domain-containing protein n=1 Tax=Thalassomonas haliotis TaxID=485448 RepID=A0ABY7VKX1_9GAMM|nr:DUF58 domain-containing protein [Thalassomonas haliotis]WDE13317.1 DUF58 domain-containing protein [Thalassomonas haliotis]
MWFSKSTKQTQQTDAAQVLHSIMASGVGLSIEELLQYQTKTSLIDLAANKNLHGRMSGNYLARSKGRGMEFDEVRHYQTGDDIRAIDWRVTARTGKTHTKLFREEIERPVLIATDLSASMLFGSQLLFKSVQAAHLASLVAWHAKKRGDRIGGIVFNNQQHQELKPRSRQAGVLHYLHALTQIHQHSVEQNVEQPPADHTGNTAFEQNCARLRQLARPGSLVYLITDGYLLSKEAIRHLSQISRHCELVVCQITDPLEHHLPESKHRFNVAITDGQQDQQLTLGDKRTADLYRQKAEQIRAQRQNFISKAGARILTFSADKTLEFQLKNGVSTWTR